MADFDLVVIGAGPGGYVAAIRAAQLGLNTAIIERDAVGGVCLNWGCIPSKSLLRNAQVLNTVKNAKAFGIQYDNLSIDFNSAIDRSRQVVSRLTTGVEYLLKKNSVELIKGNAVLEDSRTISIAESNRSLTTDNVIIATGARQRSLPSMPIDHETVITSKDALNLRNLPEKIVIIGAGATGVEFSHIYNSYGVEVVLIELMDRIVPNEDEEISAELQKSFNDKGIQSIIGASVESIETYMGQATVNIQSETGTSSINCDKVLVAVGVQANTDGIGLENTGVVTDKGFISVGPNMETNVTGIYAIGDVTGQMLLAHVASAQAVTAAEYIGGLNPPHLDYGLMPKAIYCEPQIASFGLTETQANDQGISIKIGKFPFAASGKAIALAETDGLIKLIVDDEIGEIIGAHMIGSEVTELLGELSMVRLLEGTSTELGWLVHPHPTISETLKEAALDTFGEAIHI
ncbi:MAG: dihydrolipoyl dehydrogenase [Chloroflexi bacterium]|nr:dihydrolipoyl dehydrogenase [Chloroflexota bacterium]